MLPNEFHEIDPIVSFYRGGVDAAGRRLADIWSWSAAELESTHDYIQWLFPLDAESGVNPAAPLVTAETRRAFAWDELLGDRLMRSLLLMLEFYGLRCARARTHRRSADHHAMSKSGKPAPADEPRDTVTITRGPEFAERARVWLQPGNHNHLRLTRVLKSLCLLGREAEARALLSCLEEIAADEGREAISPRTLEFWRHAVLATR